MAVREARRVRRMAQSVDNGTEILQLLHSAEVRDTLISTAGRGGVPVAADQRRVTQALWGRCAVGTRHKAVHRTGCCRAPCRRRVLSDQTGVRTRQDPLFTGGSTYAHSASLETRTASGILERFIESLTEEEVAEAADLVARRGAR